MAAYAEDAYGKPGYFLRSSAQAFVPLFGGSQGDMCLGAPILRFSGNVLVSDAAGNVGVHADLTNLPQGAVVLPGDVWSFQLWYRDNNPQQTSNTSDAICVEFF